jgi:hypothetical protein
MTLRTGAALRKNRAPEHQRRDSLNTQIVSRKGTSDRNRTGVQKKERATP